MKSVVEKVAWISVVILLLVCCKSRERKVTDPLAPDSGESHSGSGDTETTDTIPIEWSDTIVTDTFVKPWTPKVTQWPGQYETWDGHFVIFIDSLSPHVAELTLLSLKDWSKILSANSETPAQATDTATQYIEYTSQDSVHGVDGWMIPSESFARRMKENLDVDLLNDNLKSLGVDTMRTKSGSSNARYLCEKATKTYSLAENSNITNAGAKTKYRLRLITTKRVARK